MNFHERAETNEQQAARQGDTVSQVETTEKLSDAPEAGNSLFALGGLAVAGIAMLGWICALAWIAWRLAGWLLS
ncbi:RNA-binding protein [Bradyrhizobium cajani]|uniref:RNA-binding protein n=1 Tax=Bradyrhizobium cajani TaxID=1928661 RepID=A0A844TKE2_9BRAD|nr:RNA-binding protein [Bradyrhizobium cajani]MBR0845170.1 RNA-binding protein [Bradyrhizobium liaoningense]MBR0855519.1 RNA-binding protein [Bradyrhizobium liaoningense]MCP3369652.1 RNA-binding protein [Bradyrhizobium cajani]MVT75040.1 RNA-binding protein [Bradyrhizobium cajani]